MSINSTVLYEVKINPFRSEFAILKPETDDMRFSLNDKIIIQIQKEMFIGQITKIMGVSQPIDNIRCQILRPATDSDLTRKELINRKISETKIFFEDLLRKFKLPAKVVLIDYDINQHKVYCYITSEKKINYLLLYESAVDTLKTRVAIKQIGIRDYARSIGGLGICGRELCCRAFLQNLQSVTLYMARQQNLYVEPEKISGCCGKLRCCIAFEY